MGPADLLHERPTPYLLVDPDVLNQNVEAMAATARGLGVTLRPHAKTHKCVEVARLQADAGASGLTVATVGEAEVFSAAGCSDLFVAYPLWVDVHRGARLRAVAERATLTVGVDSVEGARALAAQVPGARVLVEVDSGQHRTGVPPEDAGALAETATRSGLEVAGVFTFPGHGYAPGARDEVAAQESRALTLAARSLEQHGVPASVVSGGSTPTARAADGLVLTELRPGVYVFGDAQQWELGSLDRGQVALTCVATVVSASAGQVVLDSGSKVLGADRPAWASGFGRLLDHPLARITGLSEHHAVVAWEGAGLPAPGTRLRVVPNHVCSSVNLVDALVLTTGDVWRVAARGANS